MTKHKTGLSNYIGTFGNAYRKNAKEKRFIAINRDILSLFFAAYSNSLTGSYSLNRIELNIRDSNALSPYLLTDQPARKKLVPNTYCYELIFPDKLPVKLFFKYMMDDLNRFFPFEASIEKREKKCYVLVNRDKYKNPCTEGGKEKLFWERGFIKRLSNQTMDVLINYLNWNMDLQVIDESGYQEAFDMDLIIEAVIKNGEVVFDTEKVKNSLKKYGFEIREEFRITDVLVIKEKNIK
jgi:Protein of unknown function (DUF3738)